MSDLEGFRQKLLSRTVFREDGCWMWTGAWIPSGYGSINWEGVNYLTHRVSWLVHNGEIPKDHGIYHKCDNPWCVNPEHLFCGTQQDNMDDKVSKDRQAKGQDNGRSVLKDEQVLEIRRLLDEGKMLQYEIADQFNVDPKTITNIRHRRQWRHL